MMGQTTIEIVKATIPILKEKGEVITRRMYEIAFAERPDYKRGFETIWMHPLEETGRARFWRSVANEYKNRKSERSPAF